MRLPKDGVYRVRVSGYTKYEEISEQLEKYEILNYELSLINTLEKSAAIFLLVKISLRDWITIYKPSVVPSYYK
jgi:hypothetical protein